LKQKLPAISISTRFTEAGGLMAYGPTRPEFGRRLAVYIDKILKGATPGQLPIEQPSKFELVVNLKAAQALGLTLPASLLARADKVIQ
jgi:putative ABC transport system substrate-binding protein